MDGGVHLVQTITGSAESRAVRCRSRSFGAAIAAGRSRSSAPTDRTKTFLARKGAA